MKKMITLLLLSTSVAFTQGTIIKDSFYSELLNETRPLNVYLPEYYNSNNYESNDFQLYIIYMEWVRVKMMVMQLYHHY